MKKCFLVVPLAIGVASASWAGTTLHGGSEAREAYERLLTELQTASGLTFVQASYDAGFLQSQAVTELRTSDADDADVLIRLRHVIEHSPVGNSGLRAARIVTTADARELDHANAEKIAALFDGATPLTIDSVIGLGGDAEHTVTIAAWQHEGMLGPVDSGAITWSIHQDNDGSVSGTGFWPGLSYTSDDGTGLSLTVGASHDRFDYQRAESGLYTGNYTAELGDLAASAAGTGMGGSLSGVQISSTAGITGDTYRGDVAFEIGSMDLPIEVDSLRIHGSVDGLPVAGLERAITAGNEVNIATLSGEEGLLESALQTYLSALGELAEPGLALNYSAELANAGGRAVASWDMEYVGDGSPSGHGTMTTVGDLIAAVKTSVQLDVDAEALAMTPAAMFMNPQMFSPWVVADAEGYRADIVLADRFMNVNGQPMPYEAMAGDLLSMPLQMLFDNAI